MTPVLVDSNVLLDILTNDPHWCAWSEDTVVALADQTALMVNPLIYAEVSVAFDRIEDLEKIIPGDIFQREALPWEAAFLAAKCYLQYRRSGGTKTSPLPDFYIGAHAATQGYRLATRDVRRFRTYFPTVELIHPP